MEISMKFTRKAFLFTGAAIVSTALAMAPAAGARTPSGTTAAAPALQMNTRGSANTNGPTSSDRDFGIARAEDRMSAQGLKHSKAAKHAHSGSTDVDTDHDAVAPHR